jgi:hypothetical protein
LDNGVWRGIIGGEFEHPVGIDEFIAKFHRQFTQGRLKVIVRLDPIGPDKQQQVGFGIDGRPGVGEEFFLAGDPAFDLGTDPSRVGRDRHAELLGMKDESARGTLDVKRTAILTLLPQVGHHGIGLGGPLVGCLEVTQGFLQSSDFLG